MCCRWKGYLYLLLHNDVVDVKETACSSAIFTPKDDRCSGTQGMPVWLGAHWFDVAVTPTAALMTCAKILALACPPPCLPTCPPAWLPICQGMAMTQCHGGAWLCSPAHLPARLPPCRLTYLPTCQCTFPLARVCSCLSHVNSSSSCMRETERQSLPQTHCRSRDSLTSGQCPPSQGQLGVALKAPGQ